MTIQQLVDRLNKLNISLDREIKTNDTELQDDKPFITVVEDTIVIGPFPETHPGKFVEVIDTNPGW